MVFHPLNTYNQGQVGQAQGAYNQDVAGAQQAQQGLQNYQQNMQGGTQMYGEQLGTARSQLGFDPQQLANAQKALATTQTTMANLPQAVQQQGGGYGTTAGAEANNMSQMGGNLQALLQGQTNQVGALANINQASLGQAQAGTQAGQQGQQMQLTALNQIYQNAANVRDQAQQNMQFLETAFQQQGQFNQDQARQYGLAQAQMAQANAQIAQLSAQTRGLNMANQVAQQQAAYQMAPNNNGGFNFTNAGRPITVQQYNAGMGLAGDRAINPMVGQNPVGPTQQRPGSSASLMGQLGYGGAF